MLLAAVMRAFSRSILRKTEAISSSPSMMAGLTRGKEQGWLKIQGCACARSRWVVGGRGFAGLLLTRGATGAGNATAENVRQIARDDHPVDSQPKLN